MLPLLTGDCTKWYTLPIQEERHLYRDFVWFRNASRGYGALIALGAILLGGSAVAKPPVKPTPAPKPTALPAPAEARLAYNFDVGKSYPYKVLLLLDGHIPGLSLS